MSKNIPIAKPDREETYDEWFLRKVDEALKEADSPDAVWIPHEEVMARAAARREKLLALASKDSSK
jgi:hypothetical protein